MSLVGASIVTGRDVGLNGGGRPERIDLVPLPFGEVAERLMAALLKSAESKDFVGSNPTLSAT